MSGSQLFIGDCLMVMADLANDSIDAIVTDPPYGLGFMGKAWDKGVPGVEFWQQMLRVAKPGAYLLAFGGTRTFHRMACAIEDAGWEIRDTIMWLYGSGFPKSHNLGDGRGTALKPAHEPIIMARKPLVGTVAANVLAYGTGALNIDLCRVPTEDKLGGGAEGGTFADQKHEGWARPWMGDAAAREAHAARVRQNVARAETLGRWPANVIHDGSEEVMAAFPQAPGQLADASSSGSRKTQNVYGAMRRGRGDEPSADSENAGAVGFKMRPGERRLDSGSAARFFYCAKASKADRDEGLDELPAIHRVNGNKWTDTDYRVTNGEREPGRESGPRKNTHPTVKPTALMRYLCRLVTPPGGTILDPFAGSGSTGKAAVLEWCNFIGIDLEADYTAIAERRIAHALANRATHEVLP